MTIPTDILVVFLTIMLGVLLRVLYKNTEAINRIDITLAGYSEKEKRDREQEKYMKDKLFSHAERLDDHEKRIFKIENK